MRERIGPSGETRRFGPGIGFNWFDYLGMGLSLLAWHDQAIE